MAENWFEKGTEKERKLSKGLREKQRRGAIGKVEREITEKEGRERAGE